MEFAKTLNGVQNAISSRYSLIAVCFLVVYTVPAALDSVKKPGQRHGTTQTTTPTV